MPTFTTELVRGSGTTMGMIVPDAVVEALGKGKRPPVTVTINGYTYRSSVAVMGGKYMIGVAHEHRKPAGVENGGVVEVTLELDTAERTVDVPADFAAALAADPVAQAAFETLSYSHKRQHTLAIEGAKAAETRARRIAKALNMLRGG